MTIHAHLADWLPRGSKAKYHASDLILSNRNRTKVVNIKLSQQQIKMLMEQLGIKVEEG